MKGRGLVPLLVLAAGTCGLFPRALFLAETFVERDLLVYQRPMRQALVDLAHSGGAVPLWNPLVAFGQPMAGNPAYAVFHPTTALFAFLPFEWAFRLPILLAPALAALGMAFFLRTLGRSRGGALFGAIVWGFGGFLLSSTNLLPMMWVAVPLPAALAFLLRVWRGGGRRDVAGLAACWGLVAFGEPASILAAGLLAAAALLAHGAPRRRRAPILCAGGLGLGTLVAAPMLLPGALLMRLTERAHGLSEAAASQWSFPPLRLVELLLPRALGHAETLAGEWNWGRALYGGRVPLVYSIFAGLLAPLLAAAVVGRARRRTAAWAGVSALGLAIALGAHTPVWGLVRRLPVVTGLRFPEKALVVPAFALAVLAAAGWDLASRRVLLRRRVRGLLGALSALAAGGAIAVAFAGAPRRVAPGLDELPPGAAGVLAADLLFPAVAALALAAALGLSKRRARTAALCAATLAELVFDGRRLVPTAPAAAVRAAPPLLAGLAARRPERPVVLLYDAERARRLGVALTLAPMRLMQWGIPTAFGLDFDATQLRWTGEGTREFWSLVSARPDLLPPLLARVGAGGVVAPPTPSRPAWAVAAASAASRGYAFFARRAIVPRGGEDCERAAARLGREAAVAVCVASPDVPALPDPPAEGRVAVVARRPGDVALSVDVEEGSGGVLALNQTWAPGWRAERDGHPVRLLRTDWGLSALVVPAGRHQVRLRYREPAVTASLALAAAALAAVLVLARP